MFTGIILGVGRIEAIQQQAEQQTTMRVTTQLSMSNWHVGDSVAVDGCCLTVTDFYAAAGFAAELSPETLKCTHFSSARPGQQVNLEPALKLGDVLGGHMVSGHVDGTGRILSVKETGGHRQLRIGLPDDMCCYTVAKGSVAVNGVSLTVNEVNAESFTVSLIPHTLSHTNLGELRRGHRVNIETDMIGRYVERLLTYRETHEPH